jgi:hypothetical protein
MSDAARKYYDDVTAVDGAARAPSPQRRAEFSPVEAGRLNVTSMIFPKLTVAASIVRPERAFRLRGTFVIDMEQLDDGLVLARHRELPVSGFGETAPEALQAFGEMFEVQYAALVEGDIAELTGDAIEAREKFLSIVEEIVSQ